MYTNLVLSTSIRNFTSSVSNGIYYMKPRGNLLLCSSHIRKLRQIMIGFFKNNGAGVLQIVLSDIGPASFRYCNT